MAPDTDRPSTSISHLLPMAMLVVGVLLIGASFFPIGQSIARSQWSLEDSAAYDRISTTYKDSAYEIPSRRGLTQTEWQAERARMRQQMEALEQKLEQAKSQPQRWSRYLLGFGVVLVLAGFYAHSLGRS